MATERWWSGRKLGLVSLVVSLLEMSIIYGTAALILIEKLPHTPPQILHLGSGAWLVGTLGSLAFAIAGLIADSRRLTSFVAIIVAMAAFFICGLQMLV